MKIIKRIFIVLMIILCIGAFTNLSMVEAADPPPSVKSTVSGIGTGTNVSSGGLVDVIKDVLGLLRLLTGLISIIVIAYTGFEMVTETPEGKKRVKEKMIPIVTGVLLVFMATTIATFIVDIFE